MHVRAAIAVGLVVSLASGCRASRGDETIDCDPGQAYLVTCGCGLGECSGDPVLTICDGTVPIDGCGAGTVLATDDDTCGLCPSVRVTCPASGALTVVSAGFAGRRSSCDWEAEASGLPPDLGD